MAYAGPPGSGRGVAAPPAAAPALRRVRAPLSRAHSPAFEEPGYHRHAQIICQLRLCPLVRPPPQTSPGQPSPPQRLLQTVALPGRRLQAGRRAHQNFLQGAQELGSLTLQPDPESSHRPLPRGRERRLELAGAGERVSPLRTVNPLENPAAQNWQHFGRAQLIPMECALMPA